MHLYRPGFGSVCDPRGSLCESLPSSENLGEVDCRACISKWQEHLETRLKEARARAAQLSSAPLSYVTAEGLLRLPPDVLARLGLVGGGGVMVVDAEPHGVRVVSNEQYVEEMFQPQKAAVTRDALERHREMVQSAAAAVDAAEEDPRLVKGYWCGPGDRDSLPDWAPVHGVLPPVLGEERDGTVLSLVRRLDSWWATSEAISWTYTHLKGIRDGQSWHLVVPAASDLRRRQGHRLVYRTTRYSFIEPQDIEAKYGPWAAKHASEQRPSVQLMLEFVTDLSGW